MSFQRKEVIGDCTLYLGDAIDILPTFNSVDALITDPVWPNCPKGLLPGSDNPTQLWNAALFVMPEYTRSVVVMRSDSDPRFLSLMEKPFARAVILPYVMPGYIGRKLGGDEIAYCFGEFIPSREGQKVIPGRAPAVQPSGRKANGHPCSRALEHFLYLVRWWSEPGETILDPFMGSGTTGVAAAKLGRKFIGIEIEEKWFDLACRRIEQAQSQGDIITSLPLQEQIMLEAI